MIANPQSEPFTHPISSPDLSPVTENIDQNLSKSIPPTELHSPTLPSPPLPISSPPSLTSRQLTAISLFVAGRSVSTVAAALGLNRNTIYRWKNHDPAFQAELKH